MLEDLKIRGNLRVKVRIFEILAAEFYFYFAVIFLFQYVFVLDEKKSFVKKKGKKRRKGKVS